MALLFSQRAGFVQGKKSGWPFELNIIIKEGFSMNWDEVDDFNRGINEEIAAYATDVILNPDKMLMDDFIVSHLVWHQIKFETGDIEEIPDNKRGVYAFSVQVESQVLPPHGYILYMGIAGRNSSRSLRERYQDYLYPKRVIKRGNISRVMGNWRSVLQFVFAAVDDTVSTEDLQRLEIQLNTALIPPYSEKDIDAEVRAQRNAW